DLNREAGKVRDRYGRNPLGQSCLLARRLVESGVKLVTVCSAFGGKVPQDAWDTHKDNFRSLKNKLLPPMDQGVTALIDDLHNTGQIDRTLLIVMVEFGRTPKITAQPAGITGRSAIPSSWLAAAFGRVRSTANPIASAPIRPTAGCFLLPT